MAISNYNENYVKNSFWALCWIDFAPESEGFTLFCIYLLGMWKYLLSIDRQSNGPIEYSQLTYAASQSPQPGGGPCVTGPTRCDGSFVHNMHSGRPTSWVYFTSTPEYGMNLRETRSISFVFSCQCALGVGCPVVSEQNTRRAAFCLRFDLHLKRKMFGKFSFLLYFGQDRSQFVPASVIYHSGIK